jgi:hypothetical protein
LRLLDEPFAFVVELDDAVYVGLDVPIAAVGFDVIQVFTNEGSVQHDKTRWEKSALAEGRGFSSVEKFYEPLRSRATELSLAPANGLDGEASPFYIRDAMKTFISSLVLLGILAGSGASCVCAEDPPALQKGKVLILKNEYTIEGDIERIGGNYRVRRNVGVTSIPAERVLSLVASLPDAYAYLHRRINLDDPDERLRLARWCRANGLQQQALTELQAAATLRPEHAETRRLLHHWTQAALTTAPAKPATPTKPQPAAPDGPPIEVTSESLGQFATRVQPILMNTCACCHATGRGGKFQLRQIYEDSISNRQSVERNLTAVLAEINLKQPENSPLLIKAVSDHAHVGRAPLRDRQIAPYRTLESWVKLTVANNPHLRDASPASAAMPSSSSSSSPLGGVEERRPKDREASEWGAEAHLPAVPVPAPVVRGQQENAAPPSANVAPGKLASQPGSESKSNSAAHEPPDPYDPELFNQKMHPEARKPGPGS